MPSTDLRPVALTALRYAALRRVVTLAGILGMLSSTGCAMHRYRPAERLDNPDLHRVYRSRIHNRFPEACRLTQRILVRRGGEDFDMTGYLFLKPDGSWRAVALGDMGMELFRFQGDPQRPEVVIKPDSFPGRPLLDGVIEDIQHVFGLKPESTTYLVQSDDEALSLIMQYDDGYLEDYLFSPEGESPTRSYGVLNGRITREVAYYDPVAYPDCEQPLARRIIVHNHRWRYSMEIVLLDVRVNN